MPLIVWVDALRLSWGVNAPRVRCGGLARGPAAPHLRRSQHGDLFGLTVSVCSSRLPAAGAGAGERRAALSVAFTSVACVCGEDPLRIC